MAFSVSWIYQVHDKYSAALRRIKRATQNFRSVADRTARSALKLGKSLQKMGKSLRQVGKDLATKVTTVIAALGTGALVAASKIENMGVSFEVLLGSAAKAKEVVRDLLDFTAKTPFQLEGVEQAGRVLLGFGVDSGKLIERLRMLGDLAAGTGGRRTIADMAVIFGKMRSKGKATMEEINQVIEGGIPIMQALAKVTGVAETRIADLVAKGRIKFPLVLKALQSMTGEGGKFEDMMGKLSLTMSGRFSTLIDNVKLLAAEFGELMNETFGIKDGISSLTEAVQSATAWLRNLRKENPQLAKVFMLVVAAVAVLGPALIAVSVTVSALGFAFAALGITIATILSPVALVVAAIVAAGAAVFVFWDELNVAWLAFKLVMKMTADVICDFFKNTVGAVFDWISGKIDWVLQKFNSFKSLVTSLPGMSLVFGDEAGGQFDTGGRDVSQEAAQQRAAMRHQFEVMGSVELGLAKGLTGPKRVQLDVGNSAGLAGAMVN